MKHLFFLSPSGNAWQNMAQDEWFLDNIGADSVLLYIYINKPSVIIGKNQNPWRECNIPAMEEDGVLLARRVSGGGAVFHDEGNVNFSFIMPEAAYDLDRQMDVILKAADALGIEASLSGRNDIEANGRKFSGNAFCSRRGNRIHHGTLLVNADLSRLSRYLNVSPQKMRSKGIESVRARVCNLCEINPSLGGGDANTLVIDALRQQFARVYKDSAIGDFAFCPETKASLDALYKKHASWEWRLGEAPRFDITFEERFTWGGVEIYMSLKDGRISSVRVFSDSLDSDISAEAEPLLLGCRYTYEDISARLLSSKKPAFADIAAALRRHNF